MNFAFLAGVVVLLNTVNPSLQDPGSTPRIKEIVLGRCYDFQKKRIGPDTSKWKDCNKIWEAFHKGFAYKDPCKLTQNDYKDFFAATEIQEIHDKIMFWSGTYKIAHEYSQDRFITLEDTFPGYLVNGLTFCGNKNLDPVKTDGIDYKSCPTWSKTCDYTGAFWGLASSEFARAARGIARIMLNGSRGDKPAYDRDSYFSRFELPNLRVPTITNLMILVIHNIQGPKPIVRDSCGGKSIRLLEIDVIQRKIPFTCIDDPDDVRHILCVDYPTIPECLFLKTPKGKPKNLARFQTHQGFSMIY